MLLLPSPTALLLPAPPSDWWHDLTYPENPSIDTVEEWWPTVLMAGWRIGWPAGGPERVLRVIWCESRGDADADWWGGSGLMQFIRPTWDWIRPKIRDDLGVDIGDDMLNPRMNILAGVWLAKWDGWSHWGTSWTWWGTARCWG